MWKTASGEPERLLPQKCRGWSEPPIFTQWPPPAGAPALNTESKSQPFSPCGSRSSYSKKSRHALSTFCFLHFSAVICCEPCLALEVQRMRPGSERHNRAARSPSLAGAMEVNGPWPQRTFCSKLKGNNKNKMICDFTFKLRNGTLRGYLMDL